MTYAVFSDKLLASSSSERPALATATPSGAGAGHGPRLRVAVVTETYPPEINGVALTLAQVVKALRARGHDVALTRPRQPADALEPGADPAREHLAAAGIDIASPAMAEHLVAGMPIPFYSNLRMGLPAKRLLVQAWSRWRPHVVHVATEGPLGLSAVRAARSLGIAITSDFRTNFHAYTQHYGLAWLKRPILCYLRHLHNLTAATMVPTAGLCSELAAQGFANLEVVSRGVDVEHFNPLLRSEALRQHWGATGEAPVVVHVGRLAAEKNLDLLVRAFRGIERALPGARLVWVGDGPLRARLQEAIPQAIFAGQRRGLELATHYASADLFLFPSLTETFGNVTAEAMASGLAVLAFDYAAAAQLIEPGRSGMLVARGNDVQFERAALALAGSPTMRKALGAQARTAVLAHDWAGVIDRFERVLWRAVGEPPAPARPVAHTISGGNAACSTTCNSPSRSRPRNHSTPPLRNAHGSVAPLSR